MLCSYTTCQELHRFSQWHTVFPHNVNGTGQFGSICPYCTDELASETLNIDDVSRWATFEVVLRSCHACGWWGLCRRDADNWKLFWYALIGTAKHFHTDDIDAPLSELREFLRRNPAHMHSVNPTRFEHLMAACLHDYFPHAEVMHVGKTADGGVDIKLILTEKETYLVQVKRRQDPACTEGVKAVRELNGVLFREAHSLGMLITTARRFSRGARAETRVQTRTDPPYKMILLSAPHVAQLLRLASPTPYRPWMEYYSELDPDHSPQVVLRIDDLLEFRQNHALLRSNRDLAIPKDLWTSATILLRMKDRKRTSTLDVRLRPWPFSADDGMVLELRPYPLPFTREKDFYWRVNHDAWRGTVADTPVDGRLGTMGWWIDHMDLWHLLGDRKRYARLYIERSDLILEQCSEVRIEDLETIRNGDRGNRTNR